MNLRYDTESIRIRITQQEAEVLLQKGVLAAMIWTPAGPVLHEMNCWEKDNLTIVTVPGSGVVPTLRNKIFVPRDALQAHINGGAELVSVLNSRESSGELRFEIDKFSSKGRSHRG